MITLSDLNKAAQAKKAAREALVRVSLAGKKVLSVAEAAKEAVTAVFPATNNALANVKHDILMVVADVQQRVESLEEELQITTIPDEELSEQMVEGYLGVMEARRKRAKEVKEVEVVKTVEAVVQASAPASTQVRARLGAGAMRVRFDDIPTTQEQ